MSKTNKLVSICFMILILTTGTVSAALSDLDGVADGQTKVATISYDRVAIMPLRINAIDIQFQFYVDNRLLDISKNLKIARCTTTFGTNVVRCLAPAGYPNDIIDVLSGIRRGYSWQADNTMKTFSVAINSAQEVFINSELARDSTLAYKVKIEVVPATPEI